MKASEALKKPGDVARRTGYPVTAHVYKSDSGVLWVQLLDRTCCVTSMHLSELLGDDWQPLAVSPVSDERVRELEERSAEWESAVEFLAEHGEHVVEGETSLNQHIENIAEAALAKHSKVLQLEAELSTLRAQLEGKWELGEPLTQEQYYELDNSTRIILTTLNGSRMEQITVGAMGEWNPGVRIYLDPRPLPTLPSEPEPEVPAVPKFINPSGLHGIIGLPPMGLGYVVRVQSKETLWVVWMDGSCGEHETAGKKAYLGPVLHPDGTTSPIEPTQELKAALEKE